MDAKCQNIIKQKILVSKYNKISHDILLTNKIEISERCEVPSGLKELLNINKKITRKFLILKVYQYLDENDMIDGVNINPNKQIKKIFNLNKNTKLNLFNINFEIDKLYKNNC